MGTLVWEAFCAVAGDDYAHEANGYIAPLDTHDTAHNTRSLSTADSEIVARVREGNVDAFRDLYLRTYRALVGFAASVIPSSTDAEELVQDVFAAVWERRGVWNPSGSIAAYLFAAVRNRANNARARANVAASAERDVETATSGSIGTKPIAPDEAASRTELRDAIARALASLPERRRLAITLRFGQGMSYAEIGQVLGVSEHAANQLVLRARDTIAPLLKAFKTD